MKKLLVFGLLPTTLLAAMGAPARAVDSVAVKGAIERGVTALRRMQGGSGTWPHNQIGATALAGLTLLECGAKPDDKAVRRAADAVRKSSIELTHTYSIALSLLFLDRLGDPGDVPLIESLVVRLLAGQNAAGGWTYNCPSISQAEARRLQGKLNERKEPSGEREPPKDTDRKRTVKDLPEEIRLQLQMIGRGLPINTPPAGVAPGGAPAPAPAPPVGGPSDNSNTQFASLALWVGRRHGLPIDAALIRLDRYFRSSQQQDGGWPYMYTPRPPGLAPNAPWPLGVSSTASMTCAGLLGLAIVDGASLERVKERKPDAKVPDISKDAHLINGLQALGVVIGNPIGEPRPGVALPQPQPGQVGGRTYYFLWSLERVAVALDLETIGKKDWYTWGAEVLLASQGTDGTWRGQYSDCGADTCFALLFLRRANLARDLTGYFQGKTKDPGQRELRGVTLDRLRSAKKMDSGIETKDAKPIVKPLEKRPTDPESARLTGELVKANGARQRALLAEMQKAKGSIYTEALAAAIPQLEGAPRRKARDALAERLTRMKDETLAEYLHDEETEIRRAAALAIAMKDSKTLTPNLISLLSDSETSVVRAAHAALKEMTKQDFGPAANASREDCDQAMLKWLQWWSKKK
ncbi:MAG TPA: HEAT repeat domain-containing protein [Gemmataceae bacterium]|jgi:hypothetical protein